MSSSTASAADAAGPSTYNYRNLSGHLMTTTTEMLGWAADAGLDKKDEKMLVWRVKKTQSWEAMRLKNITSTKKEVKDLVYEVTATVIADRQKGEELVGKDAFKWNKVVRKEFNDAGQYVTVEIKDLN